MSVALTRLRLHGARYRDPLTEIDFAAGDPSAPWLPDELLSLATVPEYASLSAAERVRLSHIDFARLCAAGLWLEGLLMSRVTAQGFVGASAAEARIMLQEVREEAGHGLMFLEMIERAGLTDVPLLGSTGLLTWVARRLTPADPEFWAMVYIGESVTNTFIARALRPPHARSICPLARQVMALHHRDEARHIAAARALLMSRIERMGLLRRRLFGTLVKLLLDRFLGATLYPTPASLASLGLRRPARAAAAVRACPRRRALARACAAPALALVARSGLHPGAAVP
jgi:hypothetical protein